MLGPNFQEGEQFQRTGHATIALYEDDPEATERVLCALHHHPDVSAYYLPDELLPMAMFSDKYDCSRALSPWVPHWCYLSTGRAPKASDIAHTILSAYLLLAFNFSEICAKAALYLSPFFRGSWQKMETMLLMPDRIITELDRLLINARDQLHMLMQAAPSHLRAANGCYVMAQFNRLCVSCGRMGRSVEDCPSCHVEMIRRTAYCTAEYRVAEYFKLLKDCELWPSIQPFSICTLSDLSGRFARTLKSCKHRCAADVSCPLREQLRRLNELVECATADLGYVSLDPYDEDLVFEGDENKEYEESEPSDGVEER